MSGHSKWHNIQARKGKQDKAKSGLFTKYGKMITVTARQGGGDIEMNFSLRLAVDKAKAINMPKDTIERAIKKGTGELNDGSSFEEVVYEGFGQGGVAIMVEAMTDNKNRTVGEIKNIFSKLGGTMAGPGSVQWQFTHFGVIRLGKEQCTTIADKAAFELAVIDAGADDMIENEYGIEIRSTVEKFKSVMDAVKSFGVEPDDAGLEWVAKETVSIDDTQSQSLHTLTEALEEHDDVRGVYTNEA